MEVGDSSSTDFYDFTKFYIAHDAMEFFNWKIQILSFFTLRNATLREVEAFITWNF